MNYMGKQYNLYNFEALFKEYLLAGNTKPVSIKNYLSDFRHFIGWLTFKLNLNSSSLNEPEEKYNSPVIVASLMSKELIKEYQSYLSLNAIPIKTINRRLSTMRKFCSFCISQGWIEENPAKQVINSKLERSFTLENSIIDEYRAHLQEDGQNNQNVTEHIKNIKNLLTI